MKAASVVVVLILAGIGCSHTVQYKLTEKDRWEGAKADKVTSVLPFDDQTAAFTNATVQLEDHKWRVNFRKQYEKQDLTNGVSKIIAKHLEHSGVFKKTVVGPSDTADWELTGTIASYSSMGAINSGAEAGLIASSFFGLAGLGVGFAATSGQKSEIRAEVELRDVTLKDRASGQVLWHDTINVSTNYVGHYLQADVSPVFQHADDCLKEAVNEMIRRLAASGVLGSPSSPAK